MTNATLEQGATSTEEMANASSHWMRRTALVAFCLLLIGTLALVFTRLIAARVPEQRATLEKLITDRTGLAVRFENVHFAWNLSGTSAVFTRVELNDQQAGRVRVVAPELRVEFDTWDFLRHQQFSLGHVTLRSPDIEIIGEPPVEESRGEPRTPGAAAKRKTVSAAEDEQEIVRRFTNWAELMPNGRIEVEGARVHLRRRGEPAARHTFTLSQAVVSRGASNFNAYGTMLLAQDVGQSLFVSAKLEGLAANSAASGDMRVIARRVFLEKLRVPGLAGRGTLDAKLHLNAGRIESVTWQASARELELNGREDGEAGVRFDHVSFTGELARDSHDVLLRFNDLQFTRGARLERAPNLAARIMIEPHSLRIARTTVESERVPFMAAEFIAGLLAPQLAEGLPVLPGGWAPTAGELRELRFDSGARYARDDSGARHARDNSRARRKTTDGWTFSAELADTEITRAADHARLGGLAAQLRLDPQGMSLTFDPAQVATLRANPDAEPRALQAGGALVFVNDASPRWRLEDFSLASGASTLLASGEWNADAPQPLTLAVAHVDRALLNEAWVFLRGAEKLPPLLAAVESGNLVQGKAQLLPLREAGETRVNWRRSSGDFTLADLTLAGEDLPLVSGLGGSLKFARGNTTLRVDGAGLDGLAITGARIDWPRGGVPRMHATLAGDLSSPVLRRALLAQGLDRLNGKVTLEADARGERELRSPDSWRLAARVSEASMPLADGVPPIEGLSGTLRYGERQLRALALEGSWLGGPLEIETRRATTRAAPGAAGPALALKGSSDAAQLLRLLGQGEAAERVTGQLAWSGVAQRMNPIEGKAEAWQISLASNLAGVESRLPAPLDKPRARQVPLSAALRVEGTVIRDFEIESGRSNVQGRVDAEATVARFELAGIAGELRRPARAGASSRVNIDRLSLDRAPGLLALAGAAMPASGGLEIAVANLRLGDQDLGALDAEIARRDDRVEFSADSRAQSPHQISVQGTCVDAGRCGAEFTFTTSRLAGIVSDARLPADWPTETLRAVGNVSWPGDVQDELVRALDGRFELETRGGDPGHQLFATANLNDGDIWLTNVQGTGPAADQVFHGNGRVGLLARDYDLTFDYEQVSLASAAVPTPARARLSRAWSVLRGSVARRGWTEPPETRRVQWHGYWDSRADDPVP